MPRKVGCHCTEGAFPTFVYGDRRDDCLSVIWTDRVGTTIYIELSTGFTFDPAFPVTGSLCSTGRAFGMVGLLNRATFAQQVAPEKANTVFKTPILRNPSDMFAVMRSRLL